jgi:acyl-CoA thioester hydrolase
MTENKISFRIRYGETDQMGYAHHGNYAQYFEMGRIEFLRSVGISYKKMEEDGLILPVHSINTRFFKPARYDDLVTLKTTLRETPSARIIFDYEIFNEKEELITKGDTTLVFVDTSKNRPIKIPKYLLEKFESFL